MSSDPAPSESEPVNVNGASAPASAASATLQLMDVETALASKHLQNPHLPFLTRHPTLARVLMMQPRGVIVAGEQQVRVQDRAALVAQMRAFLTKAREHGVDLAACPEYSCPWDALTEAVQAGVFPAAGKVWALGCESATKDQLAAALEALSFKITIVFDESVLQASGNFVDALVYLFRTHAKEGHTEVLTALIQAKTQAMGGNPFEQQYLKAGRLLYRFRNSEVPSNSLFGLLCSDTLHPDFEKYIPELRNDALVLHLQLNDNPSAEGFRKYRGDCCLYSPRTAEILCLNWAHGTELLDLDGSAKPFIREPKTMLFRDTGQLIVDDARISENHVKGCYLTNWQSHRSAAFVFSPDPHLFLLELTKPSMVGHAATTLRTGPRMINLWSWSGAADGWQPATASDRFGDYWITPYPELHLHLNSLLAKPLTAERLIQLCVGDAISLEWASPWNLPSFVLADDDTTRRLTTCWSTAGEGLAFRESCLSRFRVFASVVQNHSQFSSRLSAFRSGGFEVAYKPVTLARRLRNLHLTQGPSATAVYVGLAPTRLELTRVKKLIKAVLEQTEADGQLLAIWYHSPNMTLKDFMDEDVPEITADPGDGAVDFQNTSS